MFLLQNHGHNFEIIILESSDFSRKVERSQLAAILGNFGYTVVPQDLISEVGKSLTIAKVVQSWPTESLIKI